MTIVLFAVLALRAESNPNNQLKLMCDSLFLAIPDSLKSARVAVFPFVNNSGHADNTLGTGLAAWVMENSGAYRGLAFADPEKLRQALKAAGVSRTDLSNWSKAIQIGRKVEAGLVLFGAFSDDRGMYKVTATLFHTNSEEIVTRAMAMVPAAGAERLSQEFFSGTDEVRAAVLRSLALPGWGQIYNRQNLRGGISMGLGLGTLAFSIVTIVASVKANDTLKKHIAIEMDGYVNRVWWEGRYSDLNTAHDTKHLRAVTAGIICAGVWSLNLVDAGIVGASRARKYRPYLQMGSGNRYEAGLAGRF
jgi:TolB-like protein